MKSPKTGSGRVKSPNEVRLAKLRQWNAARPQTLPPAFSPTMTLGLQRELSGTSFEKSQKWLKGEKTRRVAGTTYDILEEAPCHLQPSTIVPEHRVVRGVYADLSLDVAKRQRDELLRTKSARSEQWNLKQQQQQQQAGGGSGAQSPTSSASGSTSPSRRSASPDYDLELRQLKLEKVVNRPNWDGTTQVLYPRLDPRRNQRPATSDPLAISPLSSSSSTGPTSPQSQWGSRTASLPFPVTASPTSLSSSSSAGDGGGADGNGGDGHKRYVANRRALDPIRHVKREQGNVLRVLTAMRTDTQTVMDRLVKDSPRHRALAASEYTKLARFMTNAAIPRVEQAALVVVDVSSPQSMQQQLSAMTEEMLDAAEVVKRLRDASSVLFVWEVMEEIERLLEEAPPVVRNAPVVRQAVDDLSRAEEAHRAHLADEFPAKSSIVQHAIDHADDPAPLALPSVMWGADVLDALRVRAEEGRLLNEHADRTLRLVLAEQVAIEARIEKDRQQRTALVRDVLGPGQRLLQRILEALESIPSATGFQGAVGLVATYDRARAVLAVVERAWATEVDLTSPTHVDEVLEVLVEYSTVFMDAATRSHELVVGTQQCSLEIEIIQAALGAEDTPKQILQVPLVAEAGKELDERIGRTQASVWAFSDHGHDISALYPQAFQQHVDQAMANELRAMRAEAKPKGGSGGGGGGGGDGDGAGGDGSNGDGGGGGGVDDVDDLDAEIAAVMLPDNGEDGGSNEPRGGGGDGGGDANGDSQDNNNATTTNNNGSATLSDEEVLREPAWMRRKVDEMTAAVQDLRSVCYETRAMVELELPLIKQRQAREVVERARMRALVDEAASLHQHCRQVLARSHEQLAKVPEVVARFANVAELVAEVSEALEPEVDLTGPEETDAALSSLDERSQQCMAAARQLAQRLEVHSTELDARVRRETHARQQHNQDQVPAIRRVLNEVEAMLSSAHPQLRKVETVRTNRAEFVERFAQLERDLGTCVDVASQAAMEAALRSFPQRCSDLAAEASFVLSVVQDEDAALTQRLAAFARMREELEPVVMWAGVDLYTSALERYNAGPDPLRTIGGVAALAIARGKERMDEEVAVWMVTPNFTHTGANETDATMTAWRKRGEDFLAEMKALDARVRELVVNMQVCMIVLVRLGLALLCCLGLLAGCCVKQQGVWVVCRRSMCP